MEQNYATELLNTIVLGSARKLGELHHLVKVAQKFDKKISKEGSKAKVIENLVAFLCHPDSFSLLWNSLTEAEREILTLHVWTNGRATASYAHKVAKKFSLAKLENKGYYFYSLSGSAIAEFKTHYVMHNSAIWLFVPRAKNTLFLEEIKNLIGEMPRAISPIKENPLFQSRETNQTDFFQIVRCANSIKISVTKKGIVNKTSALKIYNFCRYEEFGECETLAPKDAKTVDGLLTTFPLLALCMTSGLLIISEDQCLPGPIATSLLKLPHEKLIKKLFESYLKSKDFNEIDYIKGIKAKRGHFPTYGRINLFNELKKWPINKGINFEEFEEYLQLTQSEFARKDICHIIYNGHNKYNFAYWSDYETPLIHMILRVFWALGLIDVEWGLKKMQGEPFGFCVKIFKINNLGAYAFGLTDTYESAHEDKEQAPGGFVVLPDHTIMITDGNARLEHELYFDKLLTRVSTADQMPTYKLDFSTISRCLDNGYTISEIRDYLSSSDKPLPENVLQTLADWEKQCKRIKLRQVTILECDDPTLLEEVIRYSGMGAYVGEKIASAVVVDSSARAKIKKIIAKNRRYCYDDF